MNKNLELWQNVATVPAIAQKEIAAGRLKGMTDINPMWRIKTLTEQFGACGVGWIAPIKDRWIEQGDNGTAVANVICSLKIKVDGEWSEGIDGVGGSMFIAKESKGLYTSDEAFKMAYTDAISVACKMLGIGADVYWEKGGSKYTNASGQNSPKEDKRLVTELSEKAQQSNTDEETLCKHYNKTNFWELDIREIKDALLILDTKIKLQGEKQRDE